MATQPSETMKSIMKKVEETKGSNRYKDFLDYIDNSADMTEIQKEKYKQIFNEIYIKLCDSITEKARKKGNSGLDENDQYIKILRTLRYNLAEIAVTRLAEGKPVVFYTDNVKGPQGDLLLAMKGIPNIKNFIPGLSGVKIPEVVDNTDTVIEIETDTGIETEVEAATNLDARIGDFQYFVALNPDASVDNIDKHLFKLYDKFDESYDITEENFHDYPQVRYAFESFKGLAEISSTQNGTPVISKEYIGRYKYAQVKFMETLFSKMQSEGTFAMCFEDGKPAGDLKEAIKGTMFDCDLYKTVGIPLILKWKVPGSIDGYEYTLGSDGFKGKPSESNTFAIMFSMDKLSTTPIRPYNFSNMGKYGGTKTRLTDKEYRENTYLALTASTDNEYARRLLEQGYTEEQVNAMAKKVFNIQRGRYSTPVLKKPLEKVLKTTKAQKPEKITKVTPAKSVVGTKPLIFLPIKTIDYVPQTASAGRITGRDSSAKVIATKMAEARRILLENTVKGKYEGLEEISDTIALQTAQRMQFEEDANAFDVYEGVLKDGIYKSAKQAIDNDNSLVLEMGENGAKGNLKTIIEKASDEVMAVCPTFLGADAKKAKGVLVKGQQSNKITISRDGVTAEATQEEDKAQ